MKKFRLSMGPVANYAMGLGTRLNPFLIGFLSQGFSFAWTGKEQVNSFDGRRFMVDFHTQLFCPQVLRPSSSEELVCNRHSEHFKRGRTDFSRLKNVFS